MIRPAVRLVARTQRHFGPRWGWVETVRRHALPPLDPLARRRWDRPLIRQKDWDDYVCSVDLPPGEIPAVVWPDYHRNVLSTKKYRVLASGKDWEVASWRCLDPVDRDYQYHLYYFDGVQDGTDLYQHREVAPEADPKKHEEGDQEHGDPDMVLRSLLAREGVDFYTTSPQTS